MNIEIIFPIIYFIVAVIGTSFIAWGLSGRKIFQTKNTDKIQMTPILVGALFIITNIVLLAVVNYNRWFWFKVLITVFSISVVTLVYTVYEYNHVFNEKGYKSDYISDVFIICAMVAVLLAIASIVAAAVSNSAQQTIRTTFRADLKPIENNVDEGERYILQDQDIYIVYCEENDGSYNYAYIPVDDATVHYLTEEKCPYISLSEERGYSEWKAYGKLKRHVNDGTKDISYDIYIPAGSVIRGYN